MRKDKLYKKILAAVFVITVHIMFLLAGSLEQELMTFEAAAAGSIINFITMAVSGFGSGLLTVPEYKNKPRK